MPIASVAFDLKAMLAIGVSNFPDAVNVELVSEFPVLDDVKVHEVVHLRVLRWPNM